MNTNDEIRDAIRQIGQQQQTTFLRYVCSMCHDYLSDKDIYHNSSVCWDCRKRFFSTTIKWRKDVRQTARGSLRGDVCLEWGKESDEVKLFFRGTTRGLEGLPRD